MTSSDSFAGHSASEVNFRDIEHHFNKHVGAFITQVRHMNQLNIPSLTSMLSVSKKTYLEMEKGNRHYRMHIISWWSFVMGMSPLHILAQSDYFTHLPIGDYRNIRQIKLALLLQRVSSDDCLRALRELIDHCPRDIRRDVDPSLCLKPPELEELGKFLYSREYYQMIAGGLRRYIKENGLTRREFARFLDLTPRTVRRILNAEVALNYSYYARFYLSTGVYPLRMFSDGPYMKVRLKLEQRFFLVNDLIAGYASSPDMLDEFLTQLSRVDINPDWLALFKPRAVPRSRSRHNRSPF